MSRSRPSGPHGRRQAVGVVRGILTPLGFAILSALAVWLTWRVFVAWPTGQLIDDAAWQGSTFGRDVIGSVVRPIVRVISEPFLVLAAIAAFIIAALQRRWSIAIAATAMLAGANVTTQLLKERLFVRPDFDLTERAVNTLPSGHTTAAAAVAATALLIAPPRWRGPVALVGAGYAAATGMGTLAMGWHRPSDVVAAYAVAAAWYFLIEAARGLRWRPLPRGYGRAGRAGVWLWLGAGAGVLVGTAGLISTFMQVPQITTGGQTLAYVTALAGLAGTAGVAMASMLSMRPHYREEGARSRS